MKLQTLLLAAAVLIFGIAPAFAAGGSLDGKTFTGKVWMEGETPDPDSLIFKNGKFRSTACDQYGYGEAPYTIIEKDGVKTFTSTTTNKNGAQMLWTGTLNGNTVEGSAIMITQSGEKTPMKFSGAIQ